MYQVFKKLKNIYLKYMVDYKPITTFIKGMINKRKYVYSSLQNNVVLNVIKLKSHGPPL